MRGEASTRSPPLTKLSLLTGCSGVPGLPCTLSWGSSSPRCNAAGPHRTLLARTRTHLLTRATISAGISLGPLWPYVHARQVRNFNYRFFVLLRPRENGPRALRPTHRYSQPASLSKLARRIETGGGSAVARRAGSTRLSSWLRLHGLSTWPGAAGGGLTACGARRQGSPARSAVSSVGTVFVLTLVLSRSLAVLSEFSKKKEAAHPYSVDFPLILFGQSMRKRISNCN